MEWRYEIYRAIFVAFGATEVLTNVRYLFTKEGIAAARKQHKEIPEEVTDTQMKRKVICMLSFGILFLASGLLSYALHTLLYGIVLTVLILFAIYGISEALYYRYRNTFGFAAVSLVLLFVFVL